MTVHRLTSRDNPLLKKIRRVSSGSRGEPELVAAEGIRVLEEVAKEDCEIEAVVVSESFGSSPREERLFRYWQSKGARTYKTAENLFKSVSSVMSPQGAVALVRIAPRNLDQVRTGPDPLVLCGCGIQDPGNFGTLIRSAVAAGCTMVCTLKGTVSARNPKVIRSSAGAFFRIPVVEQTRLQDFEQYCTANSIRIYRTDVREGLLYTEVDLKSGCAVLLGNEGEGLDERHFARFPAIRIPMAEEVESLNVAVAGSVILFEALRQRLENSWKIS